LRHRRNANGTRGHPPDQRAVPVENVQLMIEHEPYAAVGSLREHRWAVDISDALTRPIDRDNDAKGSDKRDKEDQFLPIT
jgi:hypothetical protein